MKDSGIMLGRTTAVLAPAPRRWLAKVWGVADIHARQKWAAVWPRLASLPNQGIDLLDAGCGSGEWTLEIAARRPEWRLTGIDRDEGCIAAAQGKQRALGRGEVRFLTTDFLAFTPDASFDVILAVASTHYLARQGRGDELLRRFAEWLRPGGTLLLYGPRACEERPQPPLGGLVGGDWGFHAADLDVMVRQAGMVVRELLPQVEYFGAAAKQIASRSGRSRLGRVLTYPVQVALTAVGNTRATSSQSRSVAYLLIAGKPKSIGKGTSL